MRPETLHGRPLRGVERDRRLWVDRPGDLDRVGRSIGLRFNTLVLGEPGSGVTSLINMIVAELKDGAGREMARVSARRASSAHELLDLVGDALGREGTARSSDDRVQAAYLRLSAAGISRPDALVVVDDVPGSFAHQVFGRMRDELWELGLQWLVSGRADDEAVLLAPPADGFFETVHRVQPLSPAQIETLLDRRDGDAHLSGELRHRIAERAAGNPAR
ncbi:MAG: ATPase, partial [Chthonomonadaceae bacterium]|nr:ATPase [Chthonomonadaceae bacterium]